VGYFHHARKGFEDRKVVELELHRVKSLLGVLSRFVLVVAGSGN
jgi:hypothetical protein